MRRRRRERRRSCEERAARRAREGGVRRRGGGGGGRERDCGGGGGEAEEGGGGEEEEGGGGRGASTRGVGGRETRARGGESGAFYTLVPIRPRWRGERRSLRTLPGASLRPSLAFNPRHRRLSTPTDAFQLHPDIALYGTTLRSSRTSPPRRRRRGSPRRKRRGSRRRKRRARKPRRRRGRRGRSDEDSAAAALVERAHHQLISTLISSSRTRRAHSCHRIRCFSPRLYVVVVRCSCTRTLLRTVHRGGFTEILSDGFFLVSFIKLFFFIGSAGELTRTAHPPRP